MADCTLHNPQGAAYWLSHFQVSAPYIEQLLVCKLELRLRG